MNSRFLLWILSGLLVCCTVAVGGIARAARTGVGLQVVALPGGDLVVIQVVPDSPAQHAGFRPGDLLLSVDGHELAGSKLASISQESLWGREGEAVTIRFLRPGVAGVRKVKVIRGQLENVPQAPVEIQMLQPQQAQEKESRP